MQRSVRLDGLDTSVRTLRSPSISSDMMSTSAKSLPSAAPFVNPLPAYIGQTEASKLISSETDRNVIVTPPALQLANEFLDHVLFTILAASRSISLGALRAAVPGVLKPRLGKAALRVAEEELKEYLEDEEDVGLNNKKGAADTKFDFDVELAWKLARLRCMVYTRLGDLEEEDEDEWLEREQLAEQIHAYGRAKKGDIQMEAPSAIFLTSVIEYLGEQALYYAAQHAQRRHYQQQNAEEGSNNEITASLTPKTDEIVLDGKDMNYVGRDSPLSRLWRSWRRNTREFSSRPMSPESALSPMGYSPVHSRTESSGRPFPALSYYNKAVVVQPQSPSQVPLPMSDRDVDEIEIPGLASALSDSEDDEAEAETLKPQRPASMVHMPGAFPGSFYTPDEQHDSDSEFTTKQFGRPGFSRQRSMSSPAPIKTPLSKLTPGTRGLDEQLADTATQDVSDDVPKAEDQLHEMPADAPEVPAEPHTQETPAVPKSIEPTPTDTIIQSQAQSPSSPAISPSSSGPPSPVAHRRERLPSHDQVIVNKRAGMVGDEVAAAVGALGAGDAALAAAAAAARPERGSLADRRALSKPQRVPVPAPPQKRTVAEEMLGTGSSVLPPKDATTGASITNVADFDSMHIPMQMPPESQQVDEQATSTGSFAEASPSRLAALTSSMNAPRAKDNERTLRDTPTQRSTAGQTKIDNDTAATSGDALAQPPVVERYRPAVSHEKIRTTNESGYKTTTLIAPTGRGMHSPVSPLPPHEYRSGSPDSNLSSDSGEMVLIRQSPLASNPVQKGHARSNSASQSHHSKSSSSSSQLLGFTKDAQGRPQNVGQQRTLGTSAIDSRVVIPPPSPMNASMEGYPATGNSSTNKMLMKGGKHSEAVDESKKKSLEVLIQSNETLHYTLTPATVIKSDETFPAVRHRTGTSDMAEFLRTTGPPEAVVNRTQKAATPPPPPPSKTHEAVTISNIGLAISSPRRGVVPSSQGYRQSMQPTGRSSNPVGQPRNARTEQSSAIRDLADYARSTGPETDDQLPRALSPRPPVTSAFRSNAAGVNRAASVATSKPTNRLKLQARDPRTSRRAETSDLIDFIREGPPRTAGDHRIDRTVAPFRTTMDSEDFNNLGSFDDREFNAKYSEVSSFGSRSAGPSVTSQTALLNKSSGGAVGLPRNVITRQQAEADDGMPQKTRSRVKDPYAIDFSDDENMDDDDAEPQKNSRHEESLVDFLRNTAPPSSTAAQPILSARSVNQSPKVSQRTSMLQSNGAREDSPHLTQIGTKMDMYRPTQPTHAAHIDKSRGKPKFEARDPTMPKSGTSDLADYLKNTGPPPSANTIPQPFILANGRQSSADRDSGGFRVFGRRKGK